jgi:hypothetical protein
MPFFSATNLTEQSVTPCEPWTYTPVEKITAQVKGDKIARQCWYQNTATCHNFYVGIEGSNPNQRTSKSNPPRLLHAVVADYDLPIPDERWHEVVEKMSIKPQWVERSLGGNLRLVWQFSRPIPLDSYDFALFILTEVRKWLQLDLLPGLDAPALCDPTRLYCNGCAWTRLDVQPVPELAVQAFFVRCGKKHSFKDFATEAAVPLDVVERALAVKFPGFCWPGEFCVDSQGPSFWIPESVSPQSALVKAHGMFTFSAHAAKPFYSWGDLLGPDFASKFESDSIAAATKDVYFDGHDYWKFNESDGRFVSMSKDALSIHFRVNCRVPSKPGPDGISNLDRCLSHCHDYARVAGAGPILFQPPGRLNCCGQWIVNTAPKSSLVQPNGDPDPKFPFLSSIFDTIFDPADQKWPFLAWLRHLYVGAHEQKPGPGQSLFLAGGVGIGKTLLNRQIVGGLMGGHVDASQFLLGNANFNSSLFESPIWSVDDSTPADSDAAHRTFSSYIKAMTANQTFEYRKKFQNSFTISWSGRILVTLNLTETSSRALIAMDDSVADKVSLFRCAATPTVKFPARDIIRETICNELPALAQWLLTWKVPEELLGDSRFGVKPWHEPTLLDKARQASRSAPFSELMIEFLTRYFTDNPKAQDWCGTVTQVMRALSSDPTDEHSVRSLRLDQVNRHLEALAKDGGIECSSEVGKHKMRIWRFSRI